MNPEMLSLMRFGGNDVLDVVGIESDKQTLADRLKRPANAAAPPVAASQVGLLTFFLAFSLGGTLGAFDPPVLLPHKVSSV